MSLKQYLVEQDRFNIEQREGGGFVKPRQDELKPKERLAMDTEKRK